MDPAADDKTPNRFEISSGFVDREKME